MTEKYLLQLLEDTASRLGLEIRYENLSLPCGRSHGGYCKFEGKPLIIMDKKTSPRKKIAIIVRALCHIDVSSIFIPPAVRRVIDSPRSQ